MYTYSKLIRVFTYIMFESKIFKCVRRIEICLSEVGKFDGFKLP